MVIWTHRVAKRRRQGELSEKERLLLRLRQIRKEDEKTIETMLRDKDIAYDLQSRFHSSL